MKGRSLAVYGLLGVILLGAGVRLLFLLTPYMDSDQAINGLMARHVLQGEFPFFFYGQDYCGSIEAYWVSTVFFLLGVSRYTLNGAIALLSLFFILFVYLFARRIADPKTALLAALYSALPSYYLVFHSVLARSAYIEIPILGTLLFIFCHKILSRERCRKSHFFFLGLFCGLGMWTHFLIVYFFPPIFFLILLKGPRVWWRRSVGFFFLGLLGGGLPLWVHNILHPLATWHYLSETSGGGETFGNSLRAFFLQRFPEVLGVRDNDTGAFFLPYFSVGLYLTVGILMLLWLGVEGRNALATLKGKKDRSYGDWLLPLYLFCFPLIFALSGFASGHTSRYLMPIFSALPVSLALITRRIGSFSPFLSFLFIALNLSGNLWGTWERGPFFSAKLKEHYRQARESDEALLAWLKKAGLFRIYCLDYWTSVRLTFDAREEILFAAPYGDRYPQYTRRIDQSPRPAFLFPGDNPDFEETLKAIGGSYQKGQVSGYSIYYGFSPPPYDFEEVVPSASTEVHEPVLEGQKKVFDRDLNTRWTSGLPQKPGFTFQIDLGRIVSAIGRVTLYAGSPEDLPRGIRLEISREGRRWEKVREVPSYFGSLFWSGPHPFHRPMDRVDLIFPPRSGRFLRLTQLGTDPVYYWSVAECYVYRVRPRSSPPEADVHTVIAHLKAIAPKTFYGDPWLEANSENGRGKAKAQRDPMDGSGNGEWLRPQEGVVLAVERAYASPLADFIPHRLNGPRLEREVAGYRLFSLSPSPYFGQALEPKYWKVSANVNARAAEMAVDGKVSTRWTTDRPQRPGDFFQVDLGKVQTVSALRCRVGSSRNDFPRGLVLAYSEDGIKWSPLVGQPRPVLLRWTGETLLSGGGDLALAFTPVPLRYLRLIQNGQDPVYYWSIHELELFQGRP